MSDDVQQLENLIRAFHAYVRNELKKRCEAYKPDFKTPETFTVVTALLCRQATLALELASAPQLWNGHSAPLFLRGMADVHITVSWILLDPISRAKQYIEHGLGQAVLSAEHRKASLEAAHNDDKPTIEYAIKAEEAWINAQRLIFMIDVNVGSWSGKTTREMAQEADCLDFYNYVYTPFSQCAHSTWYHVGRYNSQPPSSSLNAPIWPPRIAEADPNPDELGLAAKYVDKTFNMFDEKILNTTPQSGIRNWLEKEIQKCFQTISENPK